ncbi:hypothetical protein [Novosphingobium sp. SG720]|uniref:hypothetical protein n=1 Tax=Novosphingobium sp. SG720 TaxID=2586998 RepID=UPI00144515B7|nr:hypothetical protein [Novosphingobium sp. SG720]NKJ43185.1 hypothetical protein [Novosphingobium sp. SG720]
MAKISDLPLVAEPSGTETAVILKDGVAQRAPLDQVVMAASAPALAAMQLLRNQTADQAAAAAASAAAAGAAVDARLGLLNPVEFEACGWLDVLVDADFRIIAGVDDTGAIYIEGVRVAAPAQYNYGGQVVVYLDAVEYEACGYLDVEVDADFRILSATELPGTATPPPVDPATLYDLIDLSDGVNTATHSLARADGALVKLAPAGSDHTALAIRPDGFAVYRSTRANGPPGGLFARDLAGLGPERPLVPYRRIVAVGDSLTYVAGIAANSYWYKLGQRLGWPAVGFGVNGQTARQAAARYGARPVYVALTGDQIPATGSAALTAISESPITPGLPNLVIAGTLANVAGKLSWDQNTGIFAFTRSAAGAAVAVAPGTRFYPTGAGVGSGAIVPYQWDGLLIAWAARNSYYEAESIIENLELIVAAQMPLSKRFFVPLCLYSNEDGIGTSNRQVIDRTNAMIKARWPKNWIDFNGPLQNAGNGSAQDLADIAAGYTPTSLRIKDSDGTTVDFLHTNAAGNAVQSDTLYNAIVAKGWNL